VDHTGSPTHPNLQILAAPTMYYSVGQAVQCIVAKIDDKQPILSMIGKCGIDGARKKHQFHIALIIFIKIIVLIFLCINIENFLPSTVLCSRCPQEAFSW